MQFHPLAYIVKLNIEMSMADLIAKLSRYANVDDIHAGKYSSKSGTHHTGTGQGSTRGTSNDSQIHWETGEKPSEGVLTELNPKERKNSDGDSSDDYELNVIRRDTNDAFCVRKEQEVKITTESLDISEGDYQGDTQSGKGDSDERPLRDTNHLGNVDKTGKCGPANIGSSAKVWAK